MADSGNNQSIEDVLSSIRRLVAEEGSDVISESPRRSISLAAAKPAVDDDEPEKLVLTPQLRVTEPEDPYQMIRALTDAADAEVAVSGDVDEFEADPSIDAALELPEDEHVQEGSEEEEVTEAYAEDQDYDPAAAMMELASALPDTTLGDAASAIEDSILADEATPEESAADSEEHSSMEMPADLVQPDDAVNSEDDPASDMTSGAIPFPKPEPEQVEPNVGESAPATPSLVDEIEEDALRDLITEIVREELSGHLGERITRNVRKLVRREIRQMMASEDFD